MGDRDPAGGPPDASPEPPRERAPRTRLSDFLLVVGGKVATVAVVFLGGVIVARTGGAAEYGAFAAGIAAILLLDGMIGAPLDLAAVRFSALHAGETQRIARFQAMALQGKLAILAIVAVAWWASTPPGDRPQSLPWLPVSLVCASLLAIRSVSTSLQIDHRFRAYSLLDIVQGAGRLAGFACLAWLGIRHSGAFLAVFGGVSAALFLFALFRGDHRFLLGRWPERDDARRMLGFGGITAGVIALGTLTGRGDLLFLSHWYSPEHIADYGAASQVFLLLGQLALYLSVVTQPRILSWARDGALPRAFRINAALVVLPLVPVLAVFFRPDLLTPPIRLVFGEDFAATPDLLRILLLGGILDLLIVPVLMVCILQQIPAAALATEGALTLLFIALVLLLVPRHDPIRAAETMAWLAVGLRAAKLAVYLALFGRARRQLHSAIT